MFRFRKKPLMTKKQWLDIKLYLLFGSKSAINKYMTKTIKHKNNRLVLDLYLKEEYDDILIDLKLRNSEGNYE